jgi:polyphosphate kinase 2 (PPK2 family)
MKRKEYDEALRKLQVELCVLQNWVKQEGLRVVVIFEGRDAAGKGGTIKAITERVSPRVFRVVALPAPSDREKAQLYFQQRYLSHFSDRGRDRDFRPQLVQPGRCRICNGLLYEGAASPLPPGLP